LADEIYSNSPYPSTLLVVEDELSVSSLLCLLLEDEGYKVLVAADGRQALEAVRASKIDLILTDIMMPHLKGTEMLSIIQTDPDYKPFSRIPVIIMSSHLPMDQLVGYNYVALLSKPFDIDFVLNTVKQALDKSQSDRV